jgi:DNA-binding GntR family transcriptional regulator
MRKADGAAGSVRRRGHAPSGPTAGGTPSGPTTTDAAAALAPTAHWAAGPVPRVAAPLRDQVFDVVRQAILDFDLRPGQRLIERQLVEDLGVSRTTVREVLARLASEGLVTVIPQRGAIVSVLSSAEAADIYEMRIALESLAVERFVERATPEQVRELRVTLAGYAKAVRQKGTANGALRAKDAFYEVLLAGANSPPLAETLTMLQGRVRLLRATSLSVPNRAAASVRELTELVDAIEQRDVARATAACAAHIRTAARTGIGRLAEIAES